MMAKKYNIYEALQAEGFKESVSNWGTPMLTKEIEKMVTVAWYGEMKASLKIEIRFSADLEVLTVSYSDGAKTPFKTKTHLNEKRAYNAIHKTAELKGFAF